MTLGEMGSSKPFPSGFVHVITVILAIQMFGGFVSNISVLIFKNALRRNKTHAPSGVLAAAAGKASSDQAVVNSTLLINLNIADLLICMTSLPMTLTYTLTGRDQGLMLCLCNEAFLSFTTSTSALNLLVISINRHQTIVSPFKKTHLRTKHLPWLLLTTWTLSGLGFGVPFILLTVSNWTRADDVHAPCFDLLNFYTPGHHFFFETYYVLIYFVSNVVVIICYSRIFRVAKSRIHPPRAIANVQSTLPNTVQTNTRVREKTMTHMTLMIVATFTICWAPHSIASIVTMVIEPSYELGMVRLSCLTMAYCAPLIHPLVYVFMRRSFRTDVRNLLTKTTTTVTCHKSIVVVSDAHESSSNTNQKPIASTSVFRDTLPTISRQLR